MSISPVVGKQNPYFIDPDKETIQKILDKDPWCQMPSDEELKSYIKTIADSLNSADIERIFRKIKPEIERRIDKDMKDFVL